MGVLLFASLGLPAHAVREEEPALWAMIPVLKHLDEVGDGWDWTWNETVNVHPDDRDAPVEIGFYLEIREIRGAIEPELLAGVGGHFGIRHIGGAIHFEGILPDASGPEAAIDVPAVVAQSVDRLALEDGTHTEDFFKFMSSPGDTRWLFAWISRMTAQTALRGAWCHPGESAPPGKRYCRISFGSLEVPVSDIPPGSGLSLQVGGYRGKNTRATIKPLTYLGNRHYLRAPVAPGNTVVIKG